MKKIYLAILCLLIANILFAQAPQGFNYQAVVRDGSGSPIANHDVSIRITILNSGGLEYYKESKTVSTNAQGVINYIIGKGELILGSFSSIPWNTGDIFMKVEIDPSGGTTYVQMGDPTKLQSVPYALYAENAKEITSQTNASDDDPIFVVKNKAGQIVFAVYQTGVRVYVEDSQITKGVRGGFAVGGLTNQSKGQQEYFRITPDSARIYVKEVPTVKGVRGGFAVGGLTNQSKTVVNRNLMFLAPDSARFWVNETVGKGVRGGFAVGGLTNQSKGAASNFMQLTPENYFIGHQSGSSMTSGLYNNFLGYQTGLSNTSGSSNAFIGYQAGYSNISGASNVFIGNQSGYSNSTGEYNTFLGYNSGFSNNSSYNSFIGYQAGKSNTSGQYNSFIGYNSGLANTAGYKNVFFGFQSGASNTSGYSNVYIGTNAGFKNNGFANVVIGDSTASQMTSGNYNILIGRKAGLSLSSGSWNVLIGESAGYSSASANYNVMIGQNAGFNTLTSFNTYLGINAGYKINSGTNNVFLGTNAGAMLESGNANTIIGIDAGRSGSWDPYDYHGYSASNNTIVGTGAGYNFDSGDKNTFMGCLSGNTLTTGSGNVFIGYKAGSGIDGVSDQLYIANEYGIPLIYGNFSTKFVGLGTTTPLSNLHIEATTLNQNGHLMVNRSATGELGGTIVIRNRTSIYPGNAAALSFVLDGSTAFETNGANASNAEIRSTVVDFTGATNLQLSNWNGSSINTGIVLASTGNVGINTAVPSTTLDVNGNAKVSGTLTATKFSGNFEGNLDGSFTGTVTGSMNSVFMGRIIMSASGEVVSTADGSYILYWDKTNGKFQITNSSGDWCDLWYKAQKGSTSEGGTNSIASGSVNADIITGTNTDLNGFEIHFGQADGNDGWCSVWLQYCHGILVGHYIKY